MGEWDKIGQKIYSTFRDPEFRGAWDMFFEAMASASCMSVGASRTGSRTLLRVRVSGKKHELHLNTRELNSSFGTQHIVGELLRKFLVCKQGILKTVYPPNEWFLEKVMGVAFSEPVLAEAKARGVGFLEDCVEYVLEKDVGRRQEEYQLEMAMERFKQAIKIALSKGASLDDMEGILKEETVMTVMES